MQNKMRCLVNNAFFVHIELDEAVPSPEGSHGRNRLNYFFRGVTFEGCAFFTIFACYD